MRTHVVIVPLCRWRRIRGSDRWCCHANHTRTDNGPATSALLNAPVGVAVDRSGNIFIADSLNGAVRRIDAKSGKITTVFSPEWFVSGVAFDSSGNLFVTGFHLWRLRADGQISKIAGDGESSEPRPNDRPSRRKRHESNTIRSPDLPRRRHPADSFRPSESKRANHPRNLWERARP